MKQKPGLKGSLSSFQGLSPCVIVKTKSIVAAGLVDVEVLVIGFSQKLIVYVDGFSEWGGVYLYSPMWK